MLKWQQVSEKTLYILTLVLLIFIPLYPKFPLFNVPLTFVAVRLEDILIALTVGVWIVHLVLAKKLNQILNDKLNQALLLFFAIGVLSLFSGIFLTQTVVPHLGLLHFLRRIEFMILLPIIITAIRSLKQLHYSLGIILIVTMIINIYALGQQYLGWPVISTGNSEFSKGLILYLTPGARVNSTFAGHYDLAVYLSMFLAGVAAIFFAVRYHLKALILIVSAVGFYVLVLTAARQAFVATLIGVVLALWIIKKRMVILLMIALAMLALIYPSQLRDRFVSTVTVNVFGEGDRFESKTQVQETRSRLNIPTLSYKEATKAVLPGKAVEATVASDITPGEPLDSTELGVYRSYNIRINQEWPRAVRAFEKNPFLGTGYSSLGLASDNDFLRSIGEVGILGSAALVLVFVVILKKLLRKLNSSNGFPIYFTAAILAMIVAFLINGIFIDVLESSKVAIIFWMMVGLGLAKDDH